MNALLNRPQQHNTLNIYRTLPPHCIAFEVADRHSLPFIAPGEVVVIDTEDRTPRVGDIYVIEWTGGRRNVCQARHSAAAWQKAGSDPRWHVGSMRTTTPAEFEDWVAAANEAIGKGKGMVPQWCGGWAEGPFTLYHLESKLVGAVVGLYKPTKERRR
ncbi:S24 family peptidase [Agrobacterium pusense]|uniref:S24/S26 family peptidase n=1 Tax=Agrobacterium pusense TaxID=648995 RepID=A0AA44ERX0_9HYPH|nr:S24/S26 family peptidase [Agrobacterium pusense]NRF12611.1 S24/S26 family peptidase [Agrobacterium pusense]NRF23322.1 S24/S26 family peptidase [Agrobacterium pusense]